MNGGKTPSSQSRRTVLTSAGTVTVLGLAGCLGTSDNGNGGDDDSNPNDGDTGTSSEISAVNGSFFMLYDLTRNVAGDQLHVEDLVPTGSHGDDWEPSPGIIEDVADADVFVYISGFRSWSDDVAASLPEDYPDVVVIDAAEGIEYITGEAGREEDPHFWMDPLRAIEAVETIRDGFIDADPDNASVYEDNAESYIDRLTDVHEQFETMAANRKHDLVVVGSHDSYQYWTDRYGFDIHSPVGISPDGQPTAGEMEEITDLVDEHGLSYILYDMYEPTNYADSLAAETGTEILPLSPIEATTEEQLEDGLGYVEHMLEINLETLEAALEVEYDDE